MIILNDFYIDRKEQTHLVVKEKCSLCGGEIDKKYLPMKDWNISGSICSKCYSKKIDEYYPGEHIRMRKD
ncbi:MAG: hypothetical protein GWN01_16170 [Nitrosopumilaceae archaeon]|nr:hypothetical protein [Nitrosopumilaceae archaeon]NIU02373.1 hypothetical protein [Nitrosopumilaceae archaeon]NIU88830.1 hypothetical protein [Nitrosopumilaceae archaeon]NIX62974.1 hypothetical protein [Nitrosopumilaceae archaeon]